MEKDNIETDKGLSLRSEEVQEIMRAMPPGIRRWGMLALGLIFLGLITGSWFFRYPETLQVPCEVMPGISPVEIPAPASGVISILTKDSAVVQRGDTLATVGSEGQKVAVMSTVKGIVRQDVRLTLGVAVTEGQNIFYLIPKGQSEVRCYISIPAEDISSVRVGQEVHLSLSPFPEDRYGTLTGKVAVIAALPDSANRFLARIELSIPLKTTAGFYISIDYPMKGIAMITLNNKRLLSKVLNLIAVDK